MTADHQLVPAAYVLLLDGPRVLLQLRRGTGFMDGHWAAAAAGHVESGESVVAGAVREAAEELGVRLDPADLVPLCAVHRTGRTGLAVDERVDFFFTCTRWHGQPRRAEEDKAAELRWFGLDELPDPVVPHELAVLRRLWAGSVPAVLTHGW